MIDVQNIFSDVKYLRRKLINYLISCVLLLRSSLLDCMLNATFALARSGDPGVNSLYFL